MGFGIISVTDTILHAERASKPRPSPELPLFEENTVLRALKLINPETLSPLEALQTLIALKKQI